MGIADVGLVGAHRVGKTHLKDMMIHAAYWKGCDFSVHEVQKQYGYNSGDQSYSWEHRKEIQIHLLDAITETLTNRLNRVAPAWLRMEHPPIIMDRTPIDLIGYLILNAPKDPTQADLDFIKGYSEECIGLTNIHYRHVVLVQPGIAVLEVEKSAGVDLIEPLHAIYMSQFLKPEFKPHIGKHIMDREMLDIRDRMNFLKDLTRESGRN